MGYYTYMWLREDGTPYYIGKGTGRRAFRNDPSRSVSMPDRSRIVVEKWESEAKAFEMEKHYIAFYGRKDLGTGILRNRSEGGDGAAGAIRSEEWRRNHAAALRGKKRAPFTAEHKANIAAARTGRKFGSFSEAHRAKLSLAAKARYERERQSCSQG